MGTTKGIYVAIGLAVAGLAIISIMLVPPNSTQSTISILDKNIEPATKRWENQTLIVKQVEYLDYWKGNFSGADSLIIDIGSFSFDYTANESGVYEMYFVNAWENQDPVSISLKYDAPQRDMKAQSLSIPYLSQMHFREIIEVGESISGNFNVTGHPNQGILFYLLLPKCSQSFSFTFVIANTGQASATTSVRLEADGKTVWSDSYSVESQKLSAGRGTARVDDCNEHTYILKLG